ncbi:MAG: hypothetical protein AUF79_05010 [Crenarchaeota archaeon 13_1_20CM_2_51_8]|nr:MAG: hypothetical protein AUF79_05010 [Crenarchaeota archaeon 13_1_20CM_2_51_8]
MSDGKEDRWMDLDLAAANVNRAGTLVGSTIAVFTFLLFFLYPRFSSGQIDPVLFQVTLTIIVLTILSFSLSGLFYYRVGVLKLTTARKRASMQMGALFWLVGTLFVILEPALILFTVGLIVVGVVALGAWLLYALVTLRDATAYGNLYGST